MTDAALYASASVTLNGAGGGQVSLGPAIPGVTWIPTSGACLVSSANAMPTFFLYLNTVGAASFEGGSASGAGDSCAIDSVTLYTGMQLIGVWTGGDPGATATFNIAGTKQVSP